MEAIQKPTISQKILFISIFVFMSVYAMTIAYVSHENLHAVIMIGTGIGLAVSMYIQSSAKDVRIIIAAKSLKYLVVAVVLIGIAALFISGPAPTNVDSSLLPH